MRKSHNECKLLCLDRNKGKFPRSTYLGSAGLGRLLPHASGKTAFELRFFSNCAWPLGQNIGTHDTEYNEDSAQRHGRQQWPRNHCPSTSPLLGIWKKKLTRTYVYPPGDGGNLEPRQHVGECRWSISDLYWPIIHQLAYVGYVGEVWDWCVINKRKWSTSPLLSPIFYSAVTGALSVCFLYPIYIYIYTISTHIL